MAVGAGSYPVPPSDRFVLVRIGIIRHEMPPASSPARTAPVDRTTAPDPRAPDHAPHPARIEIDARYRDGLLDLSQFSHVLVLWWAARRDNDVDRAVLRVHPRPAPDHLMGVFATRSPGRPNPIAVSVCALVAIDETAGIVRVAAVDADDGTPVVDLKPYIPSSDRVRSPRVAPWLPDEPE